MKTRIKVNSDSFTSYKLKIIIPIMLLILGVLLVIATAVGAVYVPFFQTIRIIIKNLGLNGNATFPEGHESIIFFVRFPRVIVAALAGSALATSGAAMQGMFRNPMADPGIIGVSSGASLGAVTAIALGLTAKSLYFLPLYASVGALAAAFLIFMLSLKGSKIPVLTLILSGIAVSMFIGAITSVILNSIHGDQVKEFLFWMTGGLNARRWEHVGISFIPIIICISILFTFGRDLNVLLMGEEEAQSVGLNTTKTRKTLIFLTSIATATAVCVSGTISFVGLVVPHIMRMIVGPDHRILLPTSAIGGAIFLVLCDLIGRMIAAPSEIGVGIVTSLVGAPYFLFLLYRAGKEGGTAQ